MRKNVLLFAALLLALVTACEDKSKNQPPVPRPPPEPVTQQAAPAKKTYDPAQLAQFAPLPAKLELPDNPLTDDKVALGRQLFFDARLSKGQDVSCNSCHDVTKNGADDKPLSTGTKKTTTHYNAPTVFNAAGGFGQGWDTPATTIEEFLVLHMKQANVFAADDKKLGEMVSSVPAYATAMKKVWPAEKEITPQVISKTISAYVRKLVTPGAWDKFLLGEQDALNADQKTGLAIFLDTNCVTCHAGKYVGATQNQKLGLAKPWPGDAGADPGRYNTSHQDADKGFFKVPSLRNVAKTGPYLHDGSVKDLDEMVKLMAHHQVGKELSSEDAKSIVTFLGALSGDPPKDLISKPDLPPSGPKTPKPE